MHHAVAAVHAGWRSTVLRIPEAVLQAMAGAYGTRPQDVEAAIGPGISLEAFEVGNEVYEAFRTVGFPMGEMARRYPAAGDGSGRMEKWHLDLWQANRGLLEELRCALYTDSFGRSVHLPPFRTFLLRTPLGHPFGAHSERYFSDGLIKNMDIW